MYYIIYYICIIKIIKIVFMKRLVLLGFVIASTICMAQTTNYVPKYSSNSTFNNSCIYQSSNKIGIGTTSPQSKLHVLGETTIEGRLNLNYFVTSDWSYGVVLNVDRDFTKAITVVNSSGVSPYEAFRVNGNGVVSTKKVYAESFEVRSDAMNIHWFDHVFDKNYNLRPISEVEKYINENHHLPEIPSQQEVNENGYNLGDMQGKLLMKIEELTLYIIELEKRISELEGKG